VAPHAPPLVWNQEFSLEKTKMTIEEWWSAESRRDAVFAADFFGAEAREM